jgi:hypothetical protein
MTIRLHVNAVLARLRQDPILADCTFQGVVEATGERPQLFCAVFPDSGFREQARYTGGQIQETYSFTIHSVGITADQAQHVAELVYAQLLGVVLAIDGRKCWPIRSVVSRPLQIDRDVTPAVHYSVDVFELTTQPA